MLESADIERWIAHEDWQQLVAGMSTLDEDARSELAPAVTDIAASLVTGQRSGSYRCYDELPERLARHVRPERARQYERPGRGAADPPRYEELRRMHAIAILAVYGCCDARRMKYGYLYTNYDFFTPAVLTILNERRPPWLAEWLDNKLARDIKDQVITWRIARGLVRCGACPRPSGPGYIRLLASPWTAEALAEDRPDRTPYTLLREDPELLEHEAWQLFEVDTFAFRRNPYTIWGWDWADAFVRLASEGAIDRQRLIDAVLGAIGDTRMHAKSRSGLVGLHASLAVTPAEREARAERYRALRAHDDPDVAKAATKLERTPARRR